MKKSRTQNSVQSVQSQLVAKERKEPLKKRPKRKKQAVPFQLTRVIINVPFVTNHLNHSFIKTKRYGYFNDYLSVL